MPNILETIAQSADRAAVAAEQIVAANTGANNTQSSETNSPGQMENHADTARKQNGVEEQQRQRADAVNNSNANNKLSDITHAVSDTQAAIEKAAEKQSKGTDDIKKLIEQILTDDTKKRDEEEKQTIIEEVLEVLHDIFDDLQNRKAEVTNNLLKSIITQLDKNRPEKFIDYSDDLKRGFDTLDKIYSRLGEIQTSADYVKTLESTITSQVVGAIEKIQSVPPTVEVKEIEVPKVEPVVVKSETQDLSKLTSAIENLPKSISIALTDLFKNGNKIDRPRDSMGNNIENSMLVPRDIMNKLANAIYDLNSRNANGDNLKDGQFQNVQQNIPSPTRGMGPVHVLVDNVDDINKGMRKELDESRTRAITAEQRMPEASVLRGQCGKSTAFLVKYLDRKWPMLGSFVKGAFGFTDGTLSSMAGAFMAPYIAKTLPVLTGILKWGGGIAAAGAAIYSLYDTYKEAEAKREKGNYRAADRVQAGNMIGTAAGTAIGALLGGPLGAMWGSMIGAYAGKAFGTWWGSNVKDLPDTSMEKAWGEIKDPAMKQKVYESDRRAAEKAFGDSDLVQGLYEGKEEALNEVLSRFNQAVSDVRKLDPNTTEGQQATARVLLMEKAIERARVGSSVSENLESLGEKAAEGVRNMNLMFAHAGARVDGALKGANLDSLNKARSRARTENSMTYDQDISKAIDEMGKASKKAELSLSPSVRYYSDFTKEKIQAMRNVHIDDHNETWELSNLPGFNDYSEREGYYNFDLKNENLQSIEVARAAVLDFLKSSGLEDNYSMFAITRELVSSFGQIDFSNPEAFQKAFMTEIPAILGGEAAGKFAEFIKSKEETLKSSQEKPTEKFEGISSPTSSASQNRPVVNEEILKREVVVVEKSHDRIPVLLKKDFPQTTEPVPIIPVSEESSSGKFPGQDSISRSDVGGRSALSPKDVRRNGAMVKEDMAKKYGMSIEEYEDIERRLFPESQPVHLTGPASQNRPVVNEEILKREVVVEIAASTYAALSSLPTAEDLRVTSIDTANSVSTSVIDTATKINEMIDSLDSDERMYNVYDEAISDFLENRLLPLIQNMDYSLSFMSGLKEGIDVNVNVGESTGGGSPTESGVVNANYATSPAVSSSTGIPSGGASSTRESVAGLSNFETRNVGGKSVLVPKGYNMNSYSRAKDLDVEKWMAQNLVEGGSRVSSRFGARNAGVAGASKIHGGMDFAAGTGQGIKSFVSGTVLKSTTQTKNGKMTGYGNYVQVLGDDGIIYTYGHMSQRGVKAGQRVNAGEIIGQVGNTGTSGGSHLHFDARTQDGRMIATEELARLKMQSRTPDVAGTTGSQGSTGVMPTTAPTRQMQNLLNQHGSFIGEMAKKYNIPENVLLGQIQQESGGNASAVSKAGAVGLMQLMPGTAKGLGVTDRTDPRQSIAAGARYMSQLLARYGGNMKNALMAYNWGMGNVDKYLKGQKTSIPKEAAEYADKVLGKAQNYNTGGSSTTSQESPVIPEGVTGGDVNVPMPSVVPEPVPTTPNDISNVGSEISASATALNAESVNIQAATASLSAEKMDSSQSPNSEENKPEESEIDTTRIKDSLSNLGSAAMSAYEKSKAGLAAAYDTVKDKFFGKQEEDKTLEEIINSQTSAPAPENIPEPPKSEPELPKPEEKPADRRTPNNPPAPVKEVVPDSTPSMSEPRREIRREPTEEGNVPRGVLSRESQPKTEVPSIEKSIEERRAPIVQEQPAPEKSKEPYPAGKETQLWGSWISRMGSALGGNFNQPLRGIGSIVAATGRLQEINSNSEISEEDRKIARTRTASGLAEGLNNIFGGESSSPLNILGMGLGFLSDLQQFKKDNAPKKKPGEEKPREEFKREPNPNITSPDRASVSKENKPSAPTINGEELKREEKPVGENAITPTEDDLNPEEKPITPEEVMDSSAWASKSESINKMREEAIKKDPELANAFEWLKNGSDDKADIITNDGVYKGLEEAKKLNMTRMGLTGSIDVTPLKPMEGTKKSSEVGAPKAEETPKPEGQVVGEIPVTPVTEEKPKIEYPELIPAEKAHGNLYAAMYNSSIEMAKKTGTTSPYMGDSWLAQEMRVKAGIQEANTSFDSFDAKAISKAYIEKFKDNKNVTYEDKYNALFGGPQKSDIFENPEAILKAKTPEQIFGRPEIETIQSPSEILPDIGESIAKAEAARVEANNRAQAEISQQGAKAIADAVKPKEGEKSTQPIGGGPGAGSQLVSGPMSDEETRAVSEYVLRYIFGENINGSGVLSIF